MSEYFCMQCLEIDLSGLGLQLKLDSKPEVRQHTLTWSVAEPCLASLRGAPLH